MESIKNISSHSQNNKKSYYLDEEETKTNDVNETTLDLTSILKTGHKKRKFSNTSTLNWLQTWRVSNL
tara:strand:- start:1 stop:204 length:204 start_codon:yes stop_codon:yes gene_type:complete